MTYYSALRGDAEVVEAVVAMEKHHERGPISTSTGLDCEQMKEQETDFHAGFHQDQMTRGEWGKEGHESRHKGQGEEKGHENHHPVPLGMENKHDTRVGESDLDHPWHTQVEVYGLVEVGRKHTLVEVYDHEVDHKLVVAVVGIVGVGEMTIRNDEGRIQKGRENGKKAWANHHVDMIAVVVVVELGPFHGHRVEEKQR